MTEKDKLYADELRNKALADYERLDHAIDELERQTCETPHKNLEITSQDCISRQEAIRIAEQGQIQGYEWQFKELCNLPSVTPKAESEDKE